MDCSRSCYFYHLHNCKLLLNADCSMIPKCPKEHIKNMDKESLEYYLATHEPTLYWRWLMSQSDIPKVGEVVMTLRNGFGSFTGGDFVKVVSIRDNHIFLGKGDSQEEKWCVPISEWSEALLRIEYV